MEQIAQWMESHALPCPTRAWLHIDCPGCGMQRAFADLLRGDLAESWGHYPPLIPFLLTLILLVVALWSRFTWRLPVLKGAFVLTGLSILINYSLRLWSA